MKGEKRWHEDMNNNDDICTGYIMFNSLIYIHRIEIVSTLSKRLLSHATRIQDLGDENPSSTTTVVLVVPIAILGRGGICICISVALIS